MNEVWVNAAGGFISASIFFTVEFMIRHHDNKKVLSARRLALKAEILRIELWLEDCQKADYEAYSTFDTSLIVSLCSQDLLLSRDEKQVGSGLSSLLRMINAVNSNVNFVNIGSGGMARTLRGDEDFQLASRNSLAEEAKGCHAVLHDFNRMIDGYFKNNSA